MSDAQNERTNSRRHRRRNSATTMPTSAEATAPMPVSTQEQWVRPAPMAAPTIRTEEYCVHHTASQSEIEPIESRHGLTKLRHLAVDHFGEATLYCDCLHCGPHEWPPSMEPLQIAIELDQYVAASTREP